MSAFGKILAPITVPTGGWTFAWVDSGVDGSVSVPAATYATALHLAAALEVAIDDDGYTSTVTVSSTGTVAINITTMTGEKWASTADALETALGFSGSETVSAHTLTSTNPHTHGWYPGTISLGSSGGVGLTLDTEWQPLADGEGVVAGSGAQSLVGPSRPAWERTLGFGYITATEMRHRTRGAVCLAAEWRFKDLVWYEDRDVGTAATPGTQGDPDDDATADYWVVTIQGSARITAHSQRPDLYTVTVTLNGEPN